MKIANLESTVLSLNDVPAFARAVDYLLENHDSLEKESNRSPIEIA
jgi:hypothetical protein